MEWRRVKEPDPNEVVEKREWVHCELTANTPALFLPHLS